MNQKYRWEIINLESVDPKILLHLGNSNVIGEITYKEMQIYFGKEKPSSKAGKRPPFIKVVEAKVPIERDISSIIDFDGLEQKWWYMVENYPEFAV